MHTLLLFLVTREMHLIRETIESLNGNCARTNHFLFNSYHSNSKIAVQKDFALNSNNVYLRTPVCVSLYLRLYLRSAPEDRDVTTVRQTGVEDTEPGRCFFFLHQPLPFLPPAPPQHHTHTHTQKRIQNWESWVEDHPLTEETGREKKKKK